MNAANTSDAVPHGESPTDDRNRDEDAPDMLRDHPPFSNLNDSETDPDVTMRSATPSPTTNPDTTTSPSTPHGNGNHAAAFPSIVEGSGGPSDSHTTVNVRNEGPATVGLGDKLPELQPDVRLTANLSLGESATQPSACLEDIEVDMEVDNENHPEQYRTKRKGKHLHKKPKW